jgi:hypothetical protein
MTRRWRLAGTATAGALSACCLAAVGCGSNGPADPLASVPAKTVATEAMANALSASGLTLTGSVVASGQPIRVNLGLIPGKGCTGTLDDGSKGTTKIIRIGETLYLKPDDTTWNVMLGSQAAKVIQLLDGRYLEESLSGASLSGPSAACDATVMFGPQNVGAVARGPMTTRDGIRVLELDGGAGSLLYVTDTAKPEIVELKGAAGAAGNSVDVNIVVGAHVTLTAPPASQVTTPAAVGL